MEAIPFFVLPRVKYFLPYAPDWARIYFFEKIGKIVTYMGNPRNLSYPFFRKSFYSISPFFMPDARFSGAPCPCPRRNTEGPAAKSFFQELYRNILAGEPTNNHAFSRYFPLSGWILTKMHFAAGPAQRVKKQTQAVRRTEVRQACVCVGNQNPPKGPFFKKPRMDRHLAFAFLGRRKSRPNTRF